MLDLFERQGFLIILTMPKRPRQSHIPSQIRRRKPRRSADFSSSLPNPDTADIAGEVAAPAAASPSGGRRLAAVTRQREGAVGRTHLAGQLPTFERAYLVRELTQIGLVSGALLVFLLVVWVLMR